MLALFKNTSKIIDILKANLSGDITDRQGEGLQHAAGFAYSSLNDKIIKSFPGLFADALQKGLHHFILLAIGFLVLLTVLD